MQTKKCSLCNQVLDISLFSIRKNRKSGIKSSCKQCCSKQVINSRDKNVWNKYQREYYKKNRELYISNARKREVLLKHNFILDEFNSFLIKELYELAKLRSTSTTIPWEVDHIIPLRHNLVCGLHVPWNMQVITRRENRSKSNKLKEV